jgi:potassium-transporting ATPase KdpC subunit
MPTRRAPTAAYATCYPKNLCSGEDVSTTEPVNKGADAQSIFFDMWRQDHPAIALQDLPGDLVTASASGLDPDITLTNTLFQLDRVAAAWAHDTRRDQTQVRIEIRQMLVDAAHASLRGLVGEPVVNVLQMNLGLRRRYGLPA